MGQLFKLIDCPTCTGRGKLSVKHKLCSYELKAYAAKCLYRAGFNYREIADVVGYKSTNSIGKLLNTETAEMDEVNKEQI